MEPSKTDNSSAFERWIKRRDGAMRGMLGMGADPASHAEVDNRNKLQIAGNRDRSRAGWTDTVGTGVRRREGRLLKRTPTAVSGVWLFLLSSLARRNSLLSLRLGARRK
jgi:hypothetical protein